MASNGYHASPTPYDGHVGNMNQPNPSGGNNNSGSSYYDPYSHPSYPNSYPSPAQYAPGQHTNTPPIPPPIQTSQLPPSHPPMGSEPYWNPPMSVPPQQPPPPAWASPHTAVNPGPGPGPGPSPMRPDPSYVPPELVSQITNNVIRQLQVSGAANSPQIDPWNHQQQWKPNMHTPTYPYPEPPPARLPPTPQNVPASPARPPKILNESGSRDHSPLTQTQDTFVPINDAPPSHGPPFPPPSGLPGEPSPLEKPIPPPVAYGGEQRAYNKESRPFSSPDGQGIESTTLEKIWGKLFENGRPTERLGQLLRGIAVYLVSIT